MMQSVLPRTKTDEFLFLTKIIINLNQTVLLTKPYEDFFKLNLHYQILCRRC